MFNTWEEFAYFKIQGFITLFFGPFAISQGFVFSWFNFLD